MSDQLQFLLPISLPCCIIRNIIYIASEKNHEKVPSVYVLLDILEVSDLFYPYIPFFSLIAMCDIVSFE